MSWQRLSRRSEHYQDLTFRADGQILIAGATGGWVRWWATADGAPLRIGMRQRQPIWSVALAPDGQRIAGGLEDGTIALWRLDQEQPERLLGRAGAPPVIGVRWARDGQHIVVWDADGLRLWQLTEAQPMWEQPVVPGGVATVAWSADGSWLATAGWHGPAHLWRAADGAWLRTWEGAWLMEPLLAFAPGHARLALGYGDGGVAVWGVPLGGLLQELGPLPEIIRSLAYSPDGTLLAAGDATGAVGVWATDPPQEVVVELGRGQHLRSLAFTPEGQALRAVTEAGLVAEWAVRPGPTLEHVQTWDTPVPGGALRQAVFAPDGQTIAALTGDDAVWLWRAARPRRRPRQTRS